MIAVLNLEVMLKLKVVMLSGYSLLASFPEDFLSFLLGYKLWAFVEGLRRSPCECPVEYSGQ